MACLSKIRIFGWWLVEYRRRKWATEEPPIPLPMMHTVASSPPSGVVVEEEVCGNVRQRNASKVRIFSGNMTPAFAPLSKEEGKV